MGESQKENTFRHRNIIDDLLDLGLLIIMVIWYFTGLEIDEKTLAVLGGAGASARVSLRRILMRIWGEDLGISLEDAADSGEENSSPPESEKSEKPSDEDEIVDANADTEDDPSAATTKP